MIVHLDADAFFASVEQAADPKLRGKPVAVGGDRRGIIASASYEARKLGIYTPMPTARARKLCPRLIVLPGDFEKYEQFSKFMFSYAYDFTPEVEVASIDEGYFDLRGHHKHAPREVAEIIRRAIRQSLKITVSEGIASNKLISQVASKLRKPACFLEVQDGDERSFLAPLPNKWLPGVGPKLAGTLNTAGLAIIEQIAGTPADMLALLVGSYAPQLRALASDVASQQLPAGKLTGLGVARASSCRSPPFFFTVRREGQMIYGLTNSKGGVGKTTIAVHLAAYLARKKRAVIFIDADPQQSASAWIKELSLPIQLETLDTPEEIIHRVATLSTDADDIVIDGPAGLSETTRAIMLRADKVFLPCGPSILDLRAASKAVQLLHHAQNVRKGLPTGALIPNKLQKRGRLSQEMLGAVHQLEIPVLSGLWHRQAFADAAGQAKTVSQMGAAAFLAAHEMKQLLREMTRG